MGLWSTKRCKPHSKNEPYTTAQAKPTSDQTQGVTNIGSISTRWTVAVVLKGLAASRCCGRERELAISPRCLFESLTGDATRMARLPARTKRAKGCHQG